MSDAELAKAAETTADVFAKLTRRIEIPCRLRPAGKRPPSVTWGRHQHAAAMKVADIGISVDTAVDVAKESVGRHYSAGKISHGTR